MRRQSKPTHDPSDSELRAIERQESELRALENDDESAGSRSVASAAIDLAHVGLNEIAYVRRAVIDDAPVWSIYNAAGLPIGAAPTLEKAWGAIVQNDLQPVFVH
jgi:hypothetical protein